MVAARVGVAIEEVEDVLLAEKVLTEASDFVRFYAQRDDWTAATAPAIAVTIAVAAAARGYQNPAGFDVERSDMVNFNRADGYSSGAMLTRQEISICRALGRSGNVRSVGLSNCDRPAPRSTTDGDTPKGRTLDNPFFFGYF